MNLNVTMKLADLENPQLDTRIWDVSAIRNWKSRDMSWSRDGLEAHLSVLVLVLKKRIGLGVGLSHFLSQVKSSQVK